MSGISQSRHSRRIVPIRRSQNALACGVRTGVFRTPQPHRRHGTVDRGGIDRIAIVNEKAMRSLARDRGAELLDGPLSGRMGSDVPVRDPARTDLQHDEEVQDSEAAGHRNEEVAGVVRQYSGRRGNQHGGTCVA